MTEGKRYIMHPPIPPSHCVSSRAILGVRAVFRIHEDSRNRRLRVVIDSGDHYQSSDIQLDGADAPKIQEVFWKALPPGNYTLEAVVHRAAGPSSRVERRFELIGDPMPLPRGPVPSLRLPLAGIGCDPGIGSVPADHAVER